MIDVNSPAPDFTLPRDGGSSVTLSALRPGKVVLYFYPKDDTRGCTTEAWISPPMPLISRPLVSP